MDLVCLGVNATLVPTPGQPEQEYLALHNAGRAQFQFVEQENLSLTKIMQHAPGEKEKLLRVENDGRGGDDVALM
jgi:hypothetical protein